VRGCVVSTGQEGSEVNSMTSGVEREIEAE
jgi:hypothetical protein